MAGNLFDLDVGKIFDGLGDCADKVGIAIRGKDPELEGKVNIILAELKGKIVDASSAIATAQNQTNAIQAQSKSFFVAGARPAAMWICILAMLYNFLLFPFIAWVCIMFKFTTPPDPDVTVLMTMLFGLLGLSGMRSFDKKNGVAS